MELWADNGMFCSCYYSHTGLLLVFQIKQIATLALPWKWTKENGAVLRNVFST